MAPVVALAPRVALLFPGQGSQYPQMARDVLRCPQGPALLEQAEAISKLPLTRLMSTADAATLADPEIAQVSVLVHSLALLDQLQADGVVPGVVAGHSLGEYTAMVAAGMLDVPTAIELVALRGRAMAAAARRRPGAMGAVVGLTAEDVSAFCHASVEQPVAVANVNSPRQLVVSGVPAGVEHVLTAAQAAGALRAKALRVGGAYHSPLMAPAARTMAVVWADVPLAEPTCTLVSSLTGGVVTDARRHARRMRSQVSDAVQWRTAMATVAAHRPDVVVEVGPGRVLAGLAREQAPDLVQVALLPGRPFRLPARGARPGSATSAPSTPARPTPARPTVDRDGDAFAASA
jgi:[acyl-carrier-protein] S-malonyltransferase